MGVSFKEKAFENEEEDKTNKVETPVKKVKFQETVVDLQKNWEKEIWEKDL